MEQNEVDDPFDWEVEQILTHLYDVNAPWARQGRHRLPPSEVLGESLRRHRYDGEVLLDATKEELTTDLGLCRGELKTITNAVNIWRNQSQKHPDTTSHQKVDLERVVQRFLSQQPPSEYSRFQSTPISSSFQPLGFGGKRESPLEDADELGRHEISSIRRKSVSQDPLTVFEPEIMVNDLSGCGKITSDNRDTASYVDADTGKKRLKLSHITTTALPEANTANVNQSSPQGIVTEGRLGTPPTDAAVSSPGVNIKAELPLRTVSPIQEHIVHSEEDSGVGMVEEEGDVFVDTLDDPLIDQPPLVTTDKDGKKRVVPTLLMPVIDRMRSSHVDGEGSSYANYSSSSNIRKGYLGPKSFPAETLFFGNTPDGQGLEKTGFPFFQSLMSDSTDTEEFTITSVDRISNGRRLYVANLMKSFLHNQEQISFEREKKSYVGILPYADRLGRKHHERSFLMFPASENAAIGASREPLSKWPEFVEANSNVTIDQDGMDNAWLDDLDLLQQKYEADSGDELPVLGESGSESGWDSETRREFEASGRIRGSQSTTERKALSNDYVSKVVDEYLQAYAEKWQKRGSKRDVKAWRLWKTHMRRQPKYRTEILVSLQTRLDLLVNVKIPKIKQAIMKESWTSTRRIQNQCKSLDTLAEEQQDIQWQLPILQANDAPPKPISNPSKASARQKVSNKDRDEESDDEESFEDESMDGFIDDEGEIAAPSSQIDDGTLNMNVDSDSDESVRPPGPVNRISQRTPKKETLSLNPIVGNETSKSSSSSVTLAEKPRISSVEDAASVPPPLNSTPLSSPKINTKPPIETIDLTVSDPSPTSKPSRRRSLPWKTSSVSSSSQIKSESKMDTQRSAKESEMESANTTRLKGRRQSFRSGHQEDSGSEYEPPTSLGKRRSRQTKSPEYNKISTLDRDVHDISRLDSFPFSYYEESEDRLGLIMKILNDMNYQTRDEFIIPRLGRLPESRLWQGVYMALDDIRLPGSVAWVKDAACHKKFARLYLCWSDCKYREWNNGFSKGYIDSHMKEENFFPNFLVDLRLAIKPFQDLMSIGAFSERVSESLLQKQSTLIDEEAADSDSLHHSARKKRKRLVRVNEEAKDQREYNSKRARIYEQRRKEIQLTRVENVSTIVINPGKLDEDVFIHINPEIGSRIKKHQIEGAQFMWREVVSDETASGGCLLAHTMGLGKTMQVITLLVTIAEAAKSTDNDIVRQIPEALKISRTLILCPPSLIDNWEEEFMDWAPHPLQNNVGLVRKIQSGSRLVNRLADIEAWSQEGGVLIIGYEMFRQLVENKETGKKLPSIAQRCEAARETLLDRPTLIVADEAHLMRNTTARITQLARLFKSKSRIALTGSPLANNLIEYYTMIDWLAPNYLSSKVEFKAFYVEPIAEGLYIDSSNYEISRSRTKLKVLNEVLAPKVNRADISVLKDDLKPKTEFVIKIPLTEVQRNAYAQYVRAARSSINNDVKATTLWAWLGVLSLLCTHPALYRNKLLGREEKAKRTKSNLETAQSSSLTDKDAGGDGSLEDANLSDAAVATSLNLQLAEMVNSSTDDIEDLSHSYRIKILIQILECALQANDKVLVFSQMIATLDFVETILRNRRASFIRLDGSTKMSDRQKLTKDFNSGDVKVGLISTKAGGQGLNLYGANRVVILDFGFNPSWEEQAIGRAYRIGQLKPVYVYRFRAGGTYEDYMYNTAVFKMQLATRVVDRKTPGRHAHKKVKDMFFEPKIVDQEDLSDFRGKDPAVLDLILARQDMDRSILSIELTETLRSNVDEFLTAEELRDAEQHAEAERLRIRDPAAYREMKEREFTEEMLGHQVYAEPNSTWSSIHPPVVGSTQAPNSSTGRPFENTLPPSTALLNTFHVQNGNGLHIINPGGSGNNYFQKPKYPYPGILPTDDGPATDIRSTVNNSLVDLTSLANPLGLSDQNNIFKKFHKSTASSNISSANDLLATAHQDH